MNENNAIRITHEAIRSRPVPGLRANPFQLENVTITTIGLQRPISKVTEEKTKHPKPHKKILHSNSVLVICVWNFGIV